MLPWPAFSRNLFIFAILVLTPLDIFRSFNQCVLSILQTLKIEYFFSEWSLTKIHVPYLITVLTRYIVALSFPTLVFFVRLSLKFVLHKLER